MGRKVRGKIKENSIKYVIKLKWIKPLKRGIYYKTKLAEFIPLVSNYELENYKVKKRKNNEKAMVKARVFLPEFMHLAKVLGFERDGRKKVLLYSEDGEAFSRILVYAVVRQTLRSEIKKNILKEIIKKLPYLEVRYWSSVFSRYFEEYRNIRALYRPARAFKEVYGLDG